MLVIICLCLGYNTMYPQDHYKCTENHLNNVILYDKKHWEEIESPHTRNKRETTAYIFLYTGLKENISWARFPQRSGNIARRFRLVFCPFLGRKGTPSQGKRKMLPPFYPKRKIAAFDCFVLSAKYYSSARNIGSQGGSMVGLSFITARTLSVRYFLSTTIRKV